MWGTVNKPGECRGPSRCNRCCHWPTEQRDSPNAEKQILHKFITTATTGTTTTNNNNNNINIQLDSLMGELWKLCPKGM